MSAAQRNASARDARLHLSKANSFYLTAARALTDQHYDPAVSDGVISAINSADVICIAALGRHNAGNDHEAAVKLLERAGPLGKHAAPILARLLPRKNMSQYRSALADRQDAERTVNDAEKLLELATQAAASLP